jgi:hypothetical protein
MPRPYDIIRVVQSNMKPKPSVKENENKNITTR